MSDWSLWVGVVFVAFAVVAAYMGMRSSSDDILTDAQRAARAWRGWSIVIVALVVVLALRLSLLWLVDHGLGVTLPVVYVPVLVLTFALAAVLMYVRGALLRRYLAVDPDQTG